MWRWLDALYHPKGGLDDSERYVRWFLATFGLVLAAVAIAALPIAVTAANVNAGWPAGLRFFGLALLVGTTGFAGGGLLGFLFGLPRVGTAAPPPQAGQATTADRQDTQSNTNLEEVSDWLTKIVVGVSLTQFSNMNGALYQFSIEVGLGAPRVPNAGFAACLILIGTAICGFLSVYLKARINLPPAFNALLIAKRSLNQVGQSSFIAEARKIIQRPLLTPDPAAQTAAADLLTNVPPGATDPETLRLTGFAQAILKNFTGAAQALGKASEGDPDNDLKLLASRASAIAGDHSGAVKMLPAAPTSGAPLDGQGFEVQLARLFAMLYSPNAADRPTAVKLGETLSHDPLGAQSPRLWLYLSSAYGQFYTALHEADAENPQLPGLRTKTLGAIDQALLLDRRNNLPILQMLWSVRYPGKPVDENDLEVFAGDTDFAARLEPKENPASGGHPPTPARVPADPNAPAPADPDAPAPTDPQPEPPVDPNVPPPADPGALAPADPNASAPADPQPNPPADPNAPVPADPSAPAPADPDAPAPADPQPEPPLDPNAPPPADPGELAPVDPNAPAPADPQPASVPDPDGPAAESNAERAAERDSRPQRNGHET